MIDNDTFRVRIGLFACKRRTPGSMTHFKKSFNHSFISPNSHFSSVFWLIYSIFMTYFMSLLLAFSISSRSNLSDNIHVSLPPVSAFSLPFLCHSYLKQFSAIIFFFVASKITAIYKEGKIRFNCRLHRFAAVFLFWVYSLNVLLIILVNPSLLNPGPQHLSVAYQNVQGLIPFGQLSSQHPLLDRCKISELQSFAIQSRPDILVLNETWLKKSISSNEILPDSQYEIFRNDRTRRTHPQDPNNPKKFRENGGGVLLAVRSDLNATVKRLTVTTGLEMLAVKVNFTNKESFIICTCYRVGTLGQPHLDTLTTYLRSLTSKRNPPKLYLVGDLNLPHANWPNSSSTIPLEQAFIDSFSNLSLSQLVTSPTHRSGNILDVLLSNHEPSIVNLQVQDTHSICKSDHFPLTFSIKSSLSRKKTPKRSLYNFKKANWAQINQDLCSINWSFLSSAHPDASWKVLKECLLNLADRYIPKVNIKSDFQPPWFDSELYSACRTKDRLRQKFKDSESLHDELKFTSSRRSFKRLYSAKLRDNLFNSDDPALITKKFWAHVKYQSNSCRIPNCVTYSDQVRFHPKEQAELFNTFFFNQFSEPSSYDIDISYVNDSNFDIDFDHRAVRKLLSNINSNKAQGPDGIHGKILKNCAVGLAFPLTCIFRASYNSGHIPEEWKLANVVPIFKKGDKASVENYRPISLTCLIMKVFERLVKEKLLSLTVDFLDPRQHGFLEQKSCTTNMVVFCDSLAMSLNENLLSHVVYFDFAKAFDSVNHDILLQKLKDLYNIDGTLLKFLSNYLSNRNQKVVIGSESSSVLKVNSGVPQGSILGPLLFVLFINDLPLGLSDGTNISLYADDTKIWRKIHSVSDCLLLQADIDHLNEWAILNKMRFHPSKCKVLPIFLRSNISSPTFTYHLNNSPLIFVDVEKDLGVDITPRLSWNSQCDRLYNKACQQLGIVRRNGHIVTDPKCRRALYLSLVRSQFENCSIVWRPTSSSLTKKLESLQKRAIKWILSEEGHSYSPELYVQKCKFLDILPLSAKFDLNDLLFFHKVVNDLVPISLPSYLSFYQGGSRLRSCHLDKLSIVSSLIPISSQYSDRSNNPFSKSFFYRTHLLWNNLSLELREILCPSLFKLEISKHLWNTLLTTNSPNFDDDFG